MKGMRLLIYTQAVDRHDTILGFFHGWLGEFANQCERIDVVCLREGEHDLPENVRIFSLGKRHTEKSLLVDRVRHTLRFLFLTARLSWDVDAIFVHMNPEYVLLGSWLWFPLRKRIILWYTHKSVTLKLRLASRLVDMVCTASPESFRLKRRNLLVTGHGIDTELFSLPRTKPVEFLRMVTIGRISRSKGVHTLISALSLLPKRGVAYRFTVVGGPVTTDDEAYYSELQALVKEKQLSEFVHFVGPREGSEVPKLLAEAYLFLHASNTGSLDKAMLEAMAERCVVISSNDAARPILREIHHALVVSDPTPEAFADAIQQVDLMDESARTEAGEALRKIVESDHSLRHLITKILWIFTQIRK